MKLFLFLLPYLFTGLAVSIIAVLIERLMINIGWIRGQTVFMVIMAFIFSILLQLMKFPKPISIDISDILLLLMMPLVVNRYDLSKTIREGRWWWKSKGDEQK